MLSEVKDVRQNEGEPWRRWFCDPQFDLYIWYSDIDAIVGFQLCYAKGTPDERAWTWYANGKVSHKKVDVSNGARRRSTPLLVPDGVFEVDSVVTAFRQAAAEMDADLRRFVCDRLECLEPD
jgi:hypothetical protein